MAVEFAMPKLGLTMEEGTIVEWLVADGAEVEQGTPVLSIETDKVTSDVEASDSGRLCITGRPGETFSCGERIGWFLAPDEAPPVAPTPTTPVPAIADERSSTAPAAHEVGAPIPSGGDGTRRFASPNARRIAGWHRVDLAQVAGSGPNGRVVSEDVIAAVGGGSAPAATAAARHLATRLGVDLRDVAPRRPGSSADRTDVERHVRERLAAADATRVAAGPTAAREPADAPLLQTPTSTIPLSGMRGTIATRMHASLHEMAQLTLTMDVVMDAVVRHRSAADPSRRAGFTDYVVAAVAGALVEHPVINSQITDGQVAVLPEINVGLAVALDGGLVVPVVHRTDTLTFDALRAETTRLAEAARNGRLTREEVDGATFSITALGMHGVDAFTPVINPPNTAILGVGRLRDGVRWDGDTPVRTTLLTLSLTWDHRAYDGVPAADFTASVRNRLEAWASP